MMSRKRYAPSTSRSVMWQRALWVGAALGIYFGYTFRPLTEPTVSVVFTLSILAALVTALFRLREPENRAVRPFLRSFAVTWVRFFLIIGLLQLRHFTYEWGGRPLTLVFTTIVGALTGLLWYVTTPESERNAR